MKVTWKKIVLFVVPLLLVVFLLYDNRETKTINVTATAYNSLRAQTHAEHPDIAAWGDKLKPGIKGIAVSRDLIKLGLRYNTKVKIEGLPGTYIVVDKMNKRWTKRIDIYMGKNKELAQEWGRQKVNITWTVRD